MRVVVAGELPREAHNAPLHLFSASPVLVDFGRGAYQQRSATTSMLLKELLTKFREEISAMYTMEDFRRDYAKKYFPRLTREEQRELLKALPPEDRLADLSLEQIRHYLDQLTAGRPSERPKRRRKKSGGGDRASISRKNDS